MNDATSTPQPSGPAPSRLYAGVLTECRDLLRKHLCQALGPALKTVEETLQSQIDDSADASVQKMLRSLRDHVRIHGPTLEQTLGKALDHRFDTLCRKYSSTTTSLYQTDMEGRLELSLVDEHEFSEALEVQNQANVLESACEEELKDLLPRIALMMGVADLDRSANPLGPEAVSEALKQACWSIDEPLDARVRLFALLARALAPELEATYRRINQHLIARKVLPYVKHAVRRGGVARQKTRKLRPRPPADETGTVLRQLFTPRDGIDQDTVTPAGDIGARTIDPQVLQMLTRLQRGEGEGMLGSDRFAVDAAAAGTVNLVHGLVEAGIGRHVGSVDGIVIDIVATLFDFIFDDERVPEAMKGLIGRLQLPVLKQALSDRSFFSNRLHPARRLISTMAHAASTWDGEFTPETSLYQAAEPLVQKIQNQAGEEEDVFATCLAALETFLAEQELRADEKAAVLTTRLEQRERQEIARGLAEAAIAEPLADPMLPESIRAFLHGAWLAVLVHAIEHGGEGGDAWRSAIDTMNDLVWSVRPKQGLEERQRLVKLLPALLRGLRAGLDVTTEAADAREAFFAELVKLHAAAVKSGMSAAIPPSCTTGDSATPPDTAATGTGEAAPPPWEMDALSRGTWVELRMESGEMRAVRLTWVSPARTMYLFANRQGQRALAMTSTELSRKFKSGDAALVDDEPFIDKIVSEVLDEYQRSEP